MSRWNTLYAYILSEGVDFAIDDSGEVENAKWANASDIRKDVAEQPQVFRPGALYAFQRLFAAIDDGLFVQPVVRS